MIQISLLKMKQIPLHSGNNVQHYLLPFNALQQKTDGNPYSSESRFPSAYSNYLYTPVTNSTYTKYTRKYKSAGWFNTFVKLFSFYCNLQKKPTINRIHPLYFRELHRFTTFYHIHTRLKLIK